MMKIVKKVVLVLVSVIVILLILALFTKKDYAVERSITINQPRQEVFNYIKFLKNQNNFSVWVMMDPNMKQEFKGTDGTVGFVSAWDSDQDDVGKGEQQIKQIVDGERLDLQIHFIKPMEAYADSYMTTDSLAENQTKVKWGFHSQMKYPMNIMLLFMDMDKMIGKDFDTGLSNLKTILEK